ncbi:hypothetical protein F4821DRAFT_228017 [Hypoxylon rubiginosum]|uniref:Uncharacterized protein n=1 Tax=Hypoxylon rubiginosum TaxID=110542 RepID=A0ACC0DDY3_9PEZI|nr:hypothetical protein F4821DRAFT_228017 [Hypoxylon rubiginosum]
MRAQPILFALAALFATSVIAQDASTTADDATTSAQDAVTTTDAQTTSATDTDTASATVTSDPTSTTDETSATSDTTSKTDDSTSTVTTSAATTTGTSSDEPLPTLPGQYSYPAPTVPPTNNAPFMQPSSMPEGTVFIAVGAILGAFGIAVLIWRAVVACLLHRSVKKAAMAQQLANDKASFPPAAPFYKYTDQASSASLGNAMSGRGVRRTTRGPIPSATPSQSNLFFSPTAPTGSGGGNRESRFLPSGFYAAGAGSPQQSHNHSISLTNLRPESRGRPLGYTPPESPSLAPSVGPRSDMGRRNMSASSLNLNRPPSGRAPSAYLEDLLDDPQNPFPPPAPSNHNTWSPSPTRR